jgi:hypothetical protein
MDAAAWAAGRESMVLNVLGWADRQVKTCQGKTEKNDWDIDVKTSA